MPGQTLLASHDNSSKNGYPTNIPPVPFSPPHTFLRTRKYDHNLSLSLSSGIDTHPLSHIQRLTYLLTHLLTQSLVYVRTQITPSLTYSFTHSHPHTHSRSLARPPPSPIRSSPPNPTEPSPPPTQAPIHHTTSPSTPSRLKAIREMGEEEKEKMIG